MKPKILLAAKINVQYYIDAVNNLGGIADAKYLPEIDTSYDGLLLCGGSDTHPKYYGQEINGAVDIDEARDENEIALCKAYLEAGKPIFGICRGFQLINTVFGGDMYQHIETADRHSSGKENDLVHGAVAKEGSLLYELYGKEFSVNSHHHQAVKSLAPGLVAMATARDGLVEAFYRPEHRFCCGVQWHPEKIWHIAPSSGRIFEAFIAACL